MKLSNAHVRLALFTEGRRLTPYAWGTNDCVTFAADAVWAITGVDPIADIRGTWASEEEALSVLESKGGLVAACDALFERIDKNYAQHGDLCMVRDANRQPSLAVCIGAYAAAPGMEEMLMTSMAEVRLAWRV